MRVNTVSSMAFVAETLGRLAEETARADVAALASSAREVLAKLAAEYAAEAQAQAPRTVVDVRTTRAGVVAVPRGWERV